ncbi:MAG TPA: hypothetical protein PLF61_06415, partial [Candidatus Goldiibacteriota bacterium]|nr:hypothetical protein [Candidatus Goldiibacteriota bacterium]
ILTAKNWWLGLSLQSKEEVVSIIQNKWVLIPDDAKEELKESTLEWWNKLKPEERDVMIADAKKKWDEILEQKEKNK